MKRNIILIAAALMLGMTACQKEEFITPDPAVNPGDNTTIRVKSAADLIGTEWEYTLNLSLGLDSADLAFLYDCMDSADVDEMLSMTFGLNFDSTYAHLTFPEDVTGLTMVEDGDSYSMEEIMQMNYTYTYDPTTLTGTLSGGNLDDITLDFTYDTVNDCITISMLFAMEDDEDNPTPFQLVFQRVI